MDSKKSILSKIKDVDRYLGIPLNFLVFLADRILSPIKFFRKKTKKNIISKILIIRLGAVGDSILSIPMVRELKRDFPKSKITLLTTSKTGGVYNEIKYVDNVMTFKFIEEKNILYSFIKNISQLKNLMKRIRREKFDIIIDTEQYSRITPLIAYFSGAKKRIGFNPEGEARGFLFNEKINHDKIKSESECFLDLLKPLNIKIKNKELEFNVKKDRTVDNFLKENIISKEDLVILMHPGNSKEFSIKRWPKERFAEVARRLIDKYNAKVILVGSPHELDLDNDIKLLSKRDLIISTGKTSNLIQLAYLISKGNLFIGNDSTPMHLSVAVKTPSIAIFGPADSRKWGHFGKKYIMLQKNLPCIPCWHRGTMNKNCNCPLPCEQAIKVNDVMKAVDDILKIKGDER